MTNQTRTIRVRILVAVDSKGQWVSHGASGQNDATKRYWIVTEGLGERVAYRWVEADVPVPAEVTVEGDVYYER